jgi:hypothetical protein
MYMPNYSTVSTGSSPSTRLVIEAAAVPARCDEASSSSWGEWLAEMSVIISRSWQRQAELRRSARAF